MAEPVRRRVAHGIVHRQGPRVEPRKHLAEVLGDPGDVGHDLGVVAARFEVRAIEASEDRDPFAAARDDERRVPGDIRADDDVERRIVVRGALAAEDKPRIDAQFAEDFGHLLELRFDHRVLHRRSPCHLTSMRMLSEWLVNSGAYMHWISAMPLW